MIDTKSQHPYHINHHAIDELARDARIGRLELRILLHLIAHNKLFIHSGETISEFHIIDQPFLAPGTAACFLTSASREDLRQVFDYSSVNSVSNRLSSLVNLGYIRRYEPIGMRTLFSFMVKPTFFTFD